MTMDIPAPDFTERIAGLSLSKRELLELKLKKKGQDLPREQRIRRRADDSSAPLSFAQQRLWFLDQFDPDGYLYNIPRAFRLSGALNVEAMHLTLDAIVARHESLRTTFATKNGTPVQVIAPKSVVALPVIDLSKLPEQQREAEVEHLVTEEAHRPFDLERGPLIRTSLLKLSDREHVLMLMMHHIVSDAWSAGVFFQELTALYDAFLMEESSPLPEPPIQYADYAVWQREWLTGEVLEQQLAYWTKQLAGAPAVLELPTDRPRPTVQSFRGEVQPLVLSKGLTGKLKELSRLEGVTLFMTLLAAFKVLLSRYSGQEDIVVGSPIANRTQVETEGLIGFFINTLVLRSDLSADPTFREVLARVRETTLGAYEHQDMPFEKLVEELQPERSLSRNPLFQVAFTMQNAPRHALQLLGLTLRPLDFSFGISKFDLLLFLSEEADELQGGVQYSTDLFEAETITRMLGHFQRLLEGIVAHPEQHISKLPLLSEAERHQLLVEWNDSETEYGRDQTVAKLFEAQVKRTPDAIAVVYKADQLTYGELNRRANQVAHYLRGRGVRAEVLVGVMMKRSLEMVIGLLGILKAGGAYVPLDAAYPQERLAFMLADAAVAMLVTEAKLVERVPKSSDAEMICLDTEWNVIAQESTENLESGAAAENLAYVIYTSGSTGQPKGVAVQHRSIVRLVKETNYVVLTSDQVFLQFAPVSFDASTFELWGCLLNGARLVVFPAGTPSLKELGEVLRRSQVTTLWLTAGLFHQMVDDHLEDLRSVRQLLAGGDVLSVPHVEKALRELTDCRLINGYGPTENTTFTCCHPMAAGVQLNGSVPIGRPIANTQVYVLDQYMNPVPIGVAGELYIGGDGLARGYLNRAELTQERFIANPFSAKAGARLYRTGDRVRYLADGTLEFLGRFDHQVKVRGYRIELGEIEATLAQHSGVRECVVLAREDTPGEKRLVGYLVAAPESAPGPSVHDLRSYVKEKLPEYMVPSAFVMLTEMPLTPNGKIDRRALPAPDQARPELEASYVAPRSAAEEVVAGIWSEVLGVERVGIYDNFFELGGHSLLATQVISRIREVLQVELPLRTLFESPVVAELSGRVEEARRAEEGLQAPPIVHLPRESNPPLSFAQQRLWFLNQMEPDSSFYNMPLAVRMNGALDVEALRQTINSIVARHESLRTTFRMVDASPVQVIAETAVVALPVTDLSMLPESDSEAEVQRLAAEEAQRPFDLARGPNLRAKLLRLAAENHVLLLTMHHIVSDGWSGGVLFKELAVLAEAFAQGEPSPLPELPIQYADYAVWQREWMQGEVLAKQLAYWKNHLGGDLPVLELPTDRARPAVQSFHGAMHSIVLSKSLSKATKVLSQREGVTLFMTLLAAFQTLLFRYTGQEDILVGTGIANRNRAEIEGLIGFFVNTLALRTDLSGNPTFRELLERVREVTLGAYEHQDLPFEKLVEELQPERDLSRNPLFQVMFAVQNAPGKALELPGVTLRQLEIDRKTAKFDLTLFMWEGKDGLHGGVEYSTDLFDAATIARLMGHYEVLLEGIVSDPDQHLSELPLLTDAERHQLFFEWNHTQQYLADTPLHHLFESQVARTPAAIALIFEDQQLTYAELNSRANQLAHYLRQRGVGPDVLVGLLLERSIEMVIAILGTLKAGGAYVPLDPAYPQERLSFMLQDADVPVLLTQQQLVENLPAQTAEVVCLDSDWGSIAHERAENVESGARPENLAYVIYTSGSTGKPKGVLVTHANVTRLFTSTDAWFDFTERDVWTLFHSYAFDFSVWELWGALLYGGRLVVVPYWVSRSPEAFYQLLSAEQVTVLNQTPSAFRQLIAVEEQAGADKELALRLVIFGGEALELQSLRGWFERHGDQRPQLVNMYGITETTVHVTYRPLRMADLEAGKGSVIGRQIPDLHLHILDRGWQPVPVGVAGEMYVGGGGVARGYLNRPELTAERFIADPCSADVGGRLYRTGDLARYLPDGDMEYLGRIDQQVKIRGFRIELGEIESTLAQHPAVRESVVVAREDTAGEKRLVAYIVSDRQDGAFAGQLPREEREKLLKNHLRYELPNGMIIAHLNVNETDFLYKEIFEEQAYLRNGITLREGDCIFDVGANIGIFTLFAGLKFKNSVIYAFEPIPPVSDVLRTNATLYGLKVKLFECGLADEPKQDTFTYYPHVSVMSGRFANEAEERELVKSFLFHQQDPGGNGTDLPSEELIDELLAERLKGESFTCQLRTISDVIREDGVERIDLLKVDVEKSEMDVLAGIQEEDWPKIRQIVVEVHDTGGRLEQMKTLLKRHGYDLVIQQDTYLQDTAIYDLYAVRPSLDRELASQSGEEHVMVGVAQNSLHEGSEEQRPEVDLQAEQVSQWQTVFNETYAQGATLEDDPTFNITGWNSSYTGETIAAAEMREWVEHTVERILSQQPRRVLEIGCGTGLLLLRVAPDCQEYFGADFSEAVLNQLEQKAQAARLSQVTLSEREATDFEGLAANGFDLVIINSVAQYFPSIDYLVRVLEGAVRVVAPGGSIFVGDVRNYELLEALHASVQLSQAAPSLSTEQLRQRVQQQLTEENELVIAPGFFTALKQHLPKISHLEVLPKRGWSDNELSKFRYDVILHVGEAVPRLEISWLDWQEQGLSLERVRQILEECQLELLAITRVPNARVMADARIMALLTNQETPQTVDKLREALRKIVGEGINPEQMWGLEQLSYSVEVSWAACGLDGSFDVVFRRQTRHAGEALLESQGAIAWPGADSSVVQAWSYYANQPLARTLFRSLVPKLRSYLQERLPDYMVPSAFVLLDEMPLTPNGKVDRRALPAPDRARPELEEQYVAPRSAVEEVMVGIWAEVLDVEEIGVYDDFFKLGGHSLKATQVISRVREAFQIELPLRSFFEQSTVAGLAAMILEDPNQRLRVDKIAELLVSLAGLSEGEVDTMLDRKSLLLEGLR